MKRSIAVLILALALALTACGGQKAADAQEGHHALPDV